MDYPQATPATHARTHPRAQARTHTRPLTLTRWPGRVPHLRYALPPPRSTPRPECGLDISARPSSLAASPEGHRTLGASGSLASHLLWRRKSPETQGLVLDRQGVLGSLVAGIGQESGTAERGHEGQGAGSTQGQLLAEPGASRRLQWRAVHAGASGSVGKAGEARRWTLASSAAGIVAPGGLCGGERGS